MWKREEPAKPETPAQSGAQPIISSTAAARTPAASGRPLGREVVNIGKSVIIKGELSGSEDLTIEGRVEGKIELRDHVLTIGPNGKIKAQVFAKSVIVMGHVTGNIVASDKINIRENGMVEGDINAPTVAISEGAQFKGSIDMQRQKVAQAVQPKGSASDAKPKTQASQGADRVASGQTAAVAPAATQARAAN